SDTEDQRMERWLKPGTTLISKHYRGRLVQLCRPTRPGRSANVGCVRALGIPVVLTLLLPAIPCREQVAGNHTPQAANFIMFPPNQPVSADQQIPKFLQADYIDLCQIGSISKFRSSEEHDYSDAFESCRSMKH